MPTSCDAINLWILYLMISSSSRIPHRVVVHFHLHCWIFQNSCASKNVIILLPMVVFWRETRLSCYFFLPWSPLKEPQTTIHPVHFTSEYNHFIMDLLNAPLTISKMKSFCMLLAFVVIIAFVGTTSATFETDALLDETRLLENILYKRDGIYDICYLFILIL